jgi:hypothetical protein
MDANNFEYKTRSAGLNPVVTLPSDFLGYSIITHDGNHYIQVDSYRDAMTLRELYNTDESKSTGYRAVTIDVLPDQTGFYVRLDESKK